MCYLQSKNTITRFSITLVVSIFLSGCLNQTGVKTSTSEYYNNPKNTDITETDHLNQWFKDRYEEELQKKPIRLTHLGSKELYDQIDDFSEAAYQEELAWRSDTVKALRANFDYDALTPDAKISYDLWVYRYERSKALAKFRRHNYLFTQMESDHSWLPNFLINIHKVDNVSDMHAYIKRISGVSRAVAQILDRAKLTASQGVRPPRFAYEGAISVARNLLGGAPFRITNDKDSPLWMDAQNKIAELTKAEIITPDQAELLRQDTRKVLIEDFQPVYRNLIDWLTTDMENSDEDAKGVHALPNGKEFYQAALVNHTDTELSAEEIHKIGLSEVSRIRTEMEYIKQNVEFNGSLNEFFTYIKTNKDFLYPNTDDGRQSYIDDSTAFFDYIRSQLPEFFGLLPKAKLVVKRVESFRERDGAAQHYSPGTKDGSRPGVYYAHLSDMNAMPKNEMEAIAYHEGIPGHHLQISIARELESVPEFRKYGAYTSFAEGWALYSESLAKEMGAYKNLNTDFGRLMTEMWRAVRLVVDTGIHAFAWTEEKAFDYFKANTPLADGQIRSEIRRYFVWPGQATAYKIGMLKILELRKRSEEILGKKFDIRAFHDTILGGGFVPLPILEKRINNWISSKID